MNESGAKQQIVDTLQNADTILVTVSADPSVDELSAALGLTMYLNDLGKHATAVVSGKIPPAISFLSPDKTFEPTVDSLRDFVIALDKEKADHLRYKVEGDVVKIFITPYKTVITSKDLQYSQGDYNVEMVIALGVTDQDHLDKALAAHGKIFHDAAVATIGMTPSKLGTMDFVDESASSLSEMVSSLAAGLRDEEKPMTSQVASALLTGVVAATDRFSNDRTSPQTMSIAATLMAAGANQQLIASKLREGAKLSIEPDDGKKRMSGDVDKNNNRQNQQGQKNQKNRRGGNNNGLSINHPRGDDETVEGASVKQDDEKNTSDNKDVRPKDALKTTDEAPKEENAEQTPEENQPSESVVEAPAQSDVAAPEDAQAVLEAALKKSGTPEVEQSAPVEEANAEQAPDQPVLESETEAPSMPDVPQSPEDQLSAQLAEVTQQPPAMDMGELPSPVDSMIGDVQANSQSQQQNAEPVFGGTLNATTEAAAEQKRRNADAERNQTILSHGESQMVDAAGPTFTAPPINGAGETGEQPSVDPFANIVTQQGAPVAPMENPVETPMMPPAPMDTLADIEQLAQGNVPAIPSVPPMDAPVQPVFDVPMGQSDVPTLPPQETMPNTPPPPPTPDFSQLPPLPAAMPDFSQLPTLPPQMGARPMEPTSDPLPLLPPENLGQTFPAPDPAMQPAPQPADPGQFRIPGQ